VISKTKHVAIALHALVWSTILLVPLLFRMPANDKVSFLEYPGSYISITNLLNASLFYLNAYLIVPTFFRKKKWAVYLLCIAGVIVVFSFAKLLILDNWFQTIEIDEWAYRFAFFSSVGFIFISSLYGIVEENLRLEKKQKEILADRLTTELKFYRSQISPHFLFNVLSTIVSLGRKKSDDLEPSLLMLSGLMRYMLYEINESKVSLTKEIEYLRSYVALQQLRFGHDDVDIETNLVVPDNSNLAIEPMLLIPFVENAFKHGIGIVANPSIKIDLRINDSTLDFSVRNRFVKNPTNKINGSEDGNSGIGLSNIRSRLKLLYADKHTLDISESDSVFNVRLNLQLK
jgi:two-component system, LytTR family, sensor kinase